MKVRDRTPVPEDAATTGCACQEPGVFNCGIMGILAGEPQDNGCRYVERCDTCERFDSDEVACGEFARLKGGRCRYDPDGYVVWLPT